MALLLREAIGDRLRHARTSQHRTLREVSRTARVSLGYLSEVERGRKEASSELLAAICDALDLPLHELLHYVAADVRAVDEMGTETVPTATVSPATVSPATVPPASVRSGSDDAAAKPQPAQRQPQPAENRMQGGRMVSAVVGNELSDLRMQPVLRHRLSAPINPKAVVAAA